MEIDRGFREFYERHFATVFRAADALSGNRTLAEEATQEAFARSWGHWRRLEGADWAVGWAVRTAVNLVKRSEKRASLPLNPTASSTRDPDTSIDVWMAIRELTTREREAVVLYYMADLPIRAVARAMKCKEGTVKAHLASARNKLGRFMQAGEV